MRYEEISNREKTMFALRPVKEKDGWIAFAKLAGWIIVLVALFLIIK